MSPFIWTEVWLWAYCGVIKMAAECQKPLKKKFFHTEKEHSPWMHPDVCDVFRLLFAIITWMKALAWPTDQPCLQNTQCYLTLLLTLAYLVVVGMNFTIKQFYCFNSTLQHDNPIETSHLFLCVSADNSII